MCLEEAEDELNKDINPEYPFHFNLPKPIIHQRMLYLKGQLNYKKNQFFLASIFFTKSIENGAVYCPEIRRKALYKLKNIFEFLDRTFLRPNQLSRLSGVDFLLDKYRPLVKDVLFLSSVA